MLPVDLRSANHLKKSAAPAIHNCKVALFMPYFGHEIDLISLGTRACNVSFYHPDI